MVSLGATPVDEDQRQDLLAEHRDITTTAELNLLEADNIHDATLWMWDQTFMTAELLDQLILRSIHRAMFERVWTWAGRIRIRETSIGIAPYLIQGSWKEGLDDTAWHIERRTASPATLALRCHHRTVQIHPFVNGNGRFARLVSDELVAALGLRVDALDWGEHLGLSADERRQAYLGALRALDTDRRDVRPMLEFALDPEVDDCWPD